MKWHRLKAILVHSYYHFTRSKETWIDLVWFPFSEFLIFGFLAKSLTGETQAIGLSLMMGLLFWEVVRIGQYCMSVSVLWEIWSKSLSNMFITPLTLSEMLFGQAIAGIAKTLGVTGLLAIFSQIFFHFSLLDLGPALILYISLLLLFSYSAGLFVNALIFRYGTDIQSLAWGLIFIFQPISAIFYPIDALPVQIRWLAYASPITYVMESARQQLATGVIHWQYLGISAVINLLYILATGWLVFKMFRWSKQTGAFARLGN